MSSTIYRLATAFLIGGCLAGTASAGDGEQAISTYLKQKQVIAASDMAQQISSSGKTQVFIAFQGRTPELSPESAEQVKELAKLIKSDGKLLIHVGFRSGPAGKDLARARARSVVNALVSNGANARQVRATNPTDPTALAFNELVRSL